MKRSTKNDRLRDEAKLTMWLYYKEHKSWIPKWIYEHREEIIAKIQTGKDPAAVFAIRMGEEPSDDQKLALLNRVLRMEQSVPNGELGLKTELIYDQDPLSGMYLTKQCGKKMEGISFLDVENSDLRPNTSKSYEPVLQAK